MEIVRAAPAQFDYYMKPPCRIGAAVVTLSRAFEIAFHSKDVSQVQTLQNVGALTTDRKQRADQVIWETLWDGLYLRTGNAILSPPPSMDTTTSASKKSAGGGKQQQSQQPGQQQDKKERPKSSLAATVSSVESRSFIHQNGIINPFMDRQGRGPASRVSGGGGDLSDDNDLVDSYGSGTSLFSRESSSLSATATTTARSSSTTKSKQQQVSIKGPSKRTRMMISASLLEAELDLEADEQRCLEERMTMGNNS